MISKSFIFFLFSTACFFANGTEALLKDNVSAKKILLAKASSSKKSAKIHKTKKSKPEAHKTNKYVLLDSSTDKPQAKGVILVFHHWPDKHNTKEKDELFKKLNSAGLKKKSEIERFKTWIFEWSTPHKGKEAQKLCKEFSDISFVKHCEPDYIVTPAVDSKSSNKKQETINHNGTNYIMLRNWVNNRGLSIANAIYFLSRHNIPTVQIDNPEVPALIAAGKSYSPTIHAIPNTSANMKLLEQFAQGQSVAPRNPSGSSKVETPEISFNQNSQRVTDPEAKGNLRSCNIVPAQANFFEGQLSDYWGQELIGADLLKEELEKTDVPDKHLVEVFDSKKRNHDKKVRNLIADEGKNSVLPEIGDNAGITNVLYTSDILREANNLLNRVDNICSVEKSEQDPSQQQASNNQDPQQQRSSNNQRTTDQTSTLQSGDITTHENTEYIMLGAWAINRDYELSSVIGSLTRAGITIQYIDNPHTDALKAAGENWSPTIHVIPNTESNKAKLEQFAQQRGTTVYNHTLNVKWKSVTDWSSVWKSATGDQTPSDHYDLEATYEVDQDKTRLYRREYKYIFRPPVLDMRGATQISTNLFNWLPPIVLLNKNNVRKLKVWGTKEVGNGSLTINGVSLTMTMVPGTISDVTGSSKRHGQWEADLTQTQFNTIYNAGTD